MKVGLKIPLRLVIAADLSCFTSSGLEMNLLTVSTPLTAFSRNAGNAEDNNQASNFTALQKINFQVGAAFGDFAGAECSVDAEVAST